MNILVQRFSDNGQSTLGIMINENSRKFMGFTLEDQHRDVKVKGDTRIPAGVYQLKIRKEDTPLTVKHREVYLKATGTAWFKYHIEITGVPGFSGVYIHAGNDELHTEGCLLIGDTAINNNIQAKNQLMSSTTAVKRFYQEVYPVLEKGEAVILEIRDEKSL